MLSSALYLYYLMCIRCCESFRAHFECNATANFFLVIFPSWIFDPCIACDTEPFLKKSVQYKLEVYVSRPRVSVNIKWAAWKMCPRWMFWFSFYSHCSFFSFYIFFYAFLWYAVFGQQKFKKNDFVEMCTCLICLL